MLAVMAPVLAARIAAIAEHPTSSAPIASNRQEIHWFATQYVRNEREFSSHSRSISSRKRCSSPKAWMMCAPLAASAK